MKTNQTYNLLGQRSLGWMSAIVALVLILQITVTRGACPFTYELLKSFGKPPPGANPSAGLLLGADGALYGTASQGGSDGTSGTVFKLNPDGTGFTVHLDFDFYLTGGNPSAGLIQGTDGALYGTAQQGGSGGYGTLFKLNPDGTGFTVLHSFDSVTGAQPSARLLQGADGALYGTTSGGGSSGYGTVFKMSPDGTGFSVLHSFDSATTGAFPAGELIQGGDDVLYGTAYFGGSNGYGTVFKLNPDGTGFTVLQNFDESTTGGYLLGGLMQGVDDTLYGTAQRGGSSGWGTVFKLNPDGTGFTVLQNFDFATGGGPSGELMQGADGALYGTTSLGGSYGEGTVFKLNPDGSGLTILKNFDALLTGRIPNPGLTQGADGVSYGTTREGGSFNRGTVFHLKSDGSDFTVLQAFTIGPDLGESGGSPFAGLIQGVDGVLYGTASSGGIYDAGTVFKINPDGSGFTVLLNFDLFTTGSSPFGGLIQGIDGALYGTASQGGRWRNGTAFKLNPDGSGFTVLHDFDFVTSSVFPRTRLTQGTDGALYGTTGEGGNSGYGTVFKLNPDGSGFTALMHFDFLTTGGFPSAGLIQGTDGALYGTAQQGGSAFGGTVFKLNPDGTGFTVLHNFDRATTGDFPYAGLIQGTDGALYGSASLGGSGSAGTVFKLNPDGTGFTVLHNFDYSMTGSSPRTELIAGPDGTFHGATPEGGSIGAGTLFQLNPDGSDFTVLVNFDGSTASGFITSGLLLGAGGNFYGTTYQGGNVGVGTVFRLIQTVDTVPPTVSCSVAVNKLFPVNNGLVNVGLSATSSESDVQVQVYSDEPEVASLQDAEWTSGVLKLRARRNPGSDGRVYLIVVTSTDPCGNIGVACSTVVIPKNGTPAALTSVQAQAAAAQAQCSANGSPQTPYRILP